MYFASEYSINKSFNFRYYHFHLITYLENLPDTCLLCNEVSTNCCCEDEGKHFLGRQALLDALSGELININPALSLNSQIKALEYNGKLEISRSSFENDITKEVSIIYTNK